MDEEKAKPFSKDDANDRRLRESCLQLAAAGNGNNAAKEDIVAKADLFYRYVKVGALK